MQKYYTAVGRFERKGRMGDMTCPMVIINNREYALDIQEMILWAALNWQIMDAGSLEDAYSAKLKASGIRPQRRISDCMRRLMQRGLVVEGCGETDEDALYRLSGAAHLGGDPRCAHRELPDHRLPHVYQGGQSPLTGGCDAG